MLTPRVSSTGGAFTNTYPASDVLCHRMGTVSETSGSHYPLARFGRHSLARALFQTGIDPHGQNRARAERFKNSTAHDSEHLSSYLRRAKYYPRAQDHPFGCPLELVIPRTRSPSRFSATLRQEHLGSGRAMPVVTRALRQASPSDQRYVRSTTAIPHFKNEHSLFRAVTESLSKVAPGALR